MKIVDTNSHLRMKFCAKGFHEQEGYKFKIKLRDNFIETGAYLHWKNEEPADIGFDLSCMSGCVETCCFCSASNIFNFVLTPDEIVGQALIALEQVIIKHPDFIEEIKKSGWITFSYQGIGEPSRIPKIISDSMKMFCEEYREKYTIQFTISTLLSNVDALAYWYSDQLHTLQISLHAADDSKRKKILGKNLPSIKEIKSVISEFRKNCKKTEIKINYLLIEGFNDSVKDLETLLYFIEGTDYFLKLSYINPTKSASAWGIKSPNENKFKIVQEYCKSKHEKTYIYGIFKETKLSCGELASYSEDYK